MKEGGPAFLQLWPGKPEDSMEGVSSIEVREEERLRQRRTEREREGSRRGGGA